ncbi:MAG: hypothetical protein ACXAE3_08525 [Candidatus Kariarchaeaceae archaeon]
MGILALIPAFFTTKNYLRTNIADFMLFSGVFICTALASFSNVVASETELLLFYKINSMVINVTFLILTLHAIRIRFDQPRKLMITLNLIYFSVLTIILFMWQLETQPDVGKVLFWELTYSSTNHHPKGAGFSLADGTIIYSTSHYLLGLVYWIYSSLILLYSYITTKPVFSSHRIRRGRQLWVLTWSILLMWAILLLPWAPKTDLINSLLLLSLLLIVFLSIKYPESLLISQTQVIRALALYEKVNARIVPEIGMDSLVEYLQNLPDSVVYSNPTES